VAALQGVVRAPLLFGLDDSLVRPLAETFAVVAGELSVTTWLSNAIWLSAEDFNMPWSLFSAWARRTLPSASVATRTSSLWGEVDSLSAQELARVLGIHVNWLYVQIRQGRLLIDRHPSDAHLFANTPPMIEAVP